MTNEDINTPMQAFDTMPGSMKDAVKDEFAHRHFSIKEKIKYFEYSHLPSRLQDVSRSCAELAITMIRTIPEDNPQLALGLQKLIEAKDCFVRANLPEE